MRRVAVAAALLALSWVGAVGGAGIANAVSSVSVGCGDTAALVAAVTSANQGGPKTIVLASDCTYTLTAAAEDSVGLPVITASITLEGSGSTIVRASGAPQFRLVEIGAGGTLRASEVTFSGGHAPDGASGTEGDDGGSGEVPEPGDNGTAGGDGAGGGGILVDSRGTLTLNDATVSSNAAGDGGAGGGGGDGGSGPTEGGPPTAGADAGNGADGGSGGEGGGILNLGSATLSNVVVTENVAGVGGDGGSGGNGGSASAGPPGDGGNGGAGGAGGAGGNGGGIFNGPGARLITLPAGAATNAVTDNDAGAGGAGGSGGAGGDATDHGPGVGGDGGDGGDGGAGGNGGGIFNDGVVSLSRTTITGNSAGAGGAPGAGGAVGESGPGAESQPVAGSTGNPGTDGEGGGIFNSGTLALNPTNVLNANSPDQCVGSGCPA